MTEIINYSPIFDKFNIHYVSSIHKYIKNIDYNNYEYEMYNLNGVRIGTETNPIKFYEYVNP